MIQPDLAPWMSIVIRGLDYVVAKIVDETDHMIQSRYGHFTVDMAS